MKDIIIRNYNCNDEEKVISIANERFGSKYFTKKSFCKYLDDKQTIIKICEVNKEIVGYCLFIIEETYKVAKQMGISEDVIKEVNGVHSREKVCITKSMAIKNSFKGLSLGSILFEKALEELEKRDVSSAWCSAWMVGDKVPMADIFKRKKFIKLCEVEGLWINDIEYECIVCKGNCKCKAAIYYKKLNNNLGE